MSARRTPSDGGSRLSPQTLIVASLASLTAAIVVSTFWQGGTPIAAAITPVVVAVASELYSRPARRISAMSARAAERTRARTAAGVRPPIERTRVGGPPSRLPEREPLREPEGVGPIRVYRSETSGRPRVHLKLALATAAIAFAIAAVVLTVPELVFGGSVASHGQTTLFGGSTHKSKRKTRTTPSSTTPTSTTPTQSQTTPTPAAPPAQTVPQTTTPSAPPSGTTGAPQGTSTPAQSGQ